MARNSHRNRAQRDDFSSYNNSIARLLAAVPVRDFLTRSVFDDLRDRFSNPVSELEDRRQWHPDGRSRPARASVRSAAQQVAARTISPQVPIGTAFAVPDQVAVCVRRHRRREVLHALKKLHGGSGAKRRRYTEFSNVSCKR